MDFNNYSYTNTDSKYTNIEDFENNSMYVFLDYSNDTYFQEQIFIVRAYSYEYNLDVFEEFNELGSAIKLYEYIKRYYSNCDEDDILQDFTNKLHDYEAERKPIMLLI